MTALRNNSVFPALLDAKPPPLFLTQQREANKETGTEKLATVKLGTFSHIHHVIKKLAPTPDMVNIADAVSVFFLHLCYF